MTTFSVPDNLDDISPPQAIGIEQSRGRALATLAAYDYHLVIPPLVEYLQTLTAGDADLDLQTFKFTDTLSGQTLGIRADQTPQIARYDKASRQSGVRRYCYCGPVMCTHAPQQWQSRQRMQLGAELFGAASPNGDWEIIRVAVDVLRAAGMTHPRLDIGHAGLFLGLAADIEATTHEALMGYVRERNTSAIQTLAAAGALSPDTARLMTVLASVAGDVSVLAEAAKSLPPLAHSALDELSYVARQLADDGVDVGVSLSEPGSYGYHTGIVFTIADDKQIIAQGGRYQAGVGFSADLRLIKLPKAEALSPPVAVPLVGDDADWLAAVDKLRKAHRRVRFVHKADALSPPFLHQQNGVWCVQEA